MAQEMVSAVAPPQPAGSTDLTDELLRVLTAF